MKRVLLIVATGLLAAAFAPPAAAQGPAESRAAIVEGPVLPGDL
jgi:hypothetical protein